MIDRENIIRMAREAGVADGIELPNEITSIEIFAEMVAAAIMPKEALAEMFEWGKDAGRHEEREACAKEAESYVTMEGYGDEIAYNIRARGQA